MKTINFDKLLLKTAFSCMACDGDIDKREVKLIKQLHKENKFFGEINITEEIDRLIKIINKDGSQFLKDYFKELTSAELTESEELELIEIAINIINADKKIEYAEIKFFKVIRSKLKIKNELILESNPDFEEYLEEDIISDTYLSKLQDDFFDIQDSPKFNLKVEIDNDILKDLEDGNEKQ